MSDDATPAKVRLTDGLGPLPAHPTARTSTGDSGWTSAEKRTIREYAAAAVAAERARCAKLADSYATFGGGNFVAAAIRAQPTVKP